MTNTSRIDELLVSMTLEEKIGQMTQVEKNSLTPEMQPSNSLSARC
jgi:hypothetical protein